MPRLLHAICHYRGQWLPADERGFRSRAHRIHSSGDYRNPPPEEEHEGLRGWMKNRAGAPIRLHPTEYETLGEAFLYKLTKLGGIIRCLSVGPTHVHVQYESCAADAKMEIGRAKQFASHQLESREGTLWGKGCTIITVRDDAHAAEVFDYIIDHSRKEGAWIWTGPALRANEDQ